MAENPTNKRSIDGMSRAQAPQLTSKKPAAIKVSAKPVKTAVASTPAPVSMTKQAASTPSPEVKKAAVPSSSTASAKPIVDKGQPPITGWSWGAFLLSWIWGIGNHVWIALLVLIPIAPINLIVAIYLGIKGNELAWRKKTWESPEQFIEVQKRWAKWGFVVLILAVVLAVGVGVLVAMSASGNISTL